MFRTSIAGETHRIAANCSGSCNLTTVPVPVWPPEYLAASAAGTSADNPAAARNACSTGNTPNIFYIIYGIPSQNRQFFTKTAKKCLEGNGYQFIILYALAKSF
ncbi:MAG TPA: hypothetical protein GX739_06785 [Firmicutes bacterium]|nr:hypothetical protein [Bacillota bacterium]